MTRRPALQAARSRLAFLAPYCGRVLAAAMLFAVLPSDAAQVALTWQDNSNDEDGFRVERAIGTGSYGLIATLSANTTNYTDTSASSATTYNYRVYAYNPAGDSGYSNTATVTTPPAANTAPTISNITNRTINEDSSTGAVAFTVADAGTAAGSLTVSGSSSNSTLVPGANIIFGGSGANRTVTVTPSANQSGTATITVTVSDGSLTAKDTFTVTVAAVNDAPTISNIASRTVNNGTSTGAIAFTVGDLETSAGSLTLSGTSSNTALVPNANIAFGGSGANRTVSVTPVAGQSGTATITVTVRDATLSASDAFVLTVNAVVNTAPTISNIANRTINEDANTGAIAFTIGDAQTSAGSLTLSGSSSNTTLVPNADIVFGGSGANRTVTVTPAANRSGSTTITVTVRDGALSATDSFALTVAAVNDKPTISDLPDRTIPQDSNTGALTFTIADLETAATALTLSGASSNTALVPASAIAFGGAGANRTVIVTPAAGASGTATITITVSDGSATASDTFVLKVNPVAPANEPPTISAIADQSIEAAGSVGPLAFNVDDAELAASSLTVSAASSNPALVPQSGLTLGGSGTSRTIAIAPAAGQHGSVAITLTVSDGTHSTSTLFDLTIAAPPAVEARMLNLSTRVMCRPGQESLIPGFVISGATSKRVLLRAVGPTLGDEPFNVPGTLPDPRMVLKRWTGTTFVDVAINDNWNTNSNADEIRAISASVFAFDLPDDSRDAVLLLDLAPGQYTVVADDASGGRGVVVLELYDTDASAGGSSFVNMSNRGFVGTGAEVMISGFVVSSEASKTLLVRAVGPTLGTAFDVPHALNDAMIEVYRRNPDGTDTLIQTHDNWGEDGDGAQVAEIASQVFAFPLPEGSKDAAFVDVFEPGIYTAIIRGVNNATGSALVEVYEVN